MTNYPLGVSGFEREIAGPEWQQASDEPCPYALRPEESEATVDGVKCGAGCVEEGYHGRRWLVCSLGHETELEG